MNFYSLLETKDMFYVMLNFLHVPSLTNLMICDKTLRTIIGKSQTWLNHVKSKAKNIDIQANKYQELCEALQDNLVVPNNIHVRDYYGESYYCFKFHQINFKGYIKILIILKDVKTM
jgi:hypothetical protein